MRKLTQEQGIAVGAFCAFVLLCVGIVAWSFQMRFDAAQELSEQQNLLERLEAGARSKAGPRGSAKAAAAPAAAFLNEPTLGLAGATLEAHVTQLASQHATLVSFAVQSSTVPDSADNVRIEASMDITLSALQILLYDLETGTPYVFVDSMTVRPAAGAAQADAANAPLRVTLGLHALWRRSPT
jgi:general secretion pathway protein M